MKALGIEIKEEEPEKDTGIIVIDQKALEERDSELIKKTLLTIAKQREGQRQSKSVGGGKFEQPQTGATEELEETKTVGGQPALKTKSITDLAKGVVEAATKTKIQLPIVLRLEGTNVEAGREILQQSGLNFIVAATMKDAAEKVVAAAKG